MRRRWAQFINHDHKPEGAARLLKLQTKLEALNRQRSPSLASHTRNTSDEPSTNKKEPLQPPTSAEARHVPATIPGPNSTIASAFYSNVVAQQNHPARRPSFPDSSRHGTRHRNSQKMGTQFK
uniref:Uncharacterized protein n=1 Tax=Glossina austeni TaxID=7395 RepID=A0A1A9VIF5_GLOAU